MLKIQAVHQYRAAAWVEAKCSLRWTGMMPGQLQLWSLRIYCKWINWIKWVEGPSSYDALGAGTVSSVHVLHHLQSTDVPHLLERQQMFEKYNMSSGSTLSFNFSEPPYQPAFSTKRSLVPNVCTIYFVLIALVFVYLKSLNKHVSQVSLNIKIWSGPRSEASRLVNNDWFYTVNLHNDWEKKATIWQYNNNHHHHH